MVLMLNFQTDEFSVQESQKDLSLFVPDKLWSDPRTFFSYYLRKDLVWAQPHTAIHISRSTLTAITVTTLFLYHKSLQAYIVYLNKYPYSFWYHSRVPLLLEWPLTDSSPTNRQTDGQTIRPLFALYIPSSSAPSSHISPLILCVWPIEGGTRPTDRSRRAGGSNDHQVCPLEVSLLVRDSG